MGKKYITMAETETEKYFGRIKGREKYSPFIGNVFYLEVQNKENKKIKRKRIGNSGLFTSGDIIFSVWNDIHKIKSIKFTDRGLEAEVVQSFNMDGWIKNFSFPKPKFPK